MKGRDTDRSDVDRGKDEGWKEGILTYRSGVDKGKSGGRKKGYSQICDVWTWQGNGRRRIMIGHVCTWKGNGEREEGY